MGDDLIDRLAATSLLYIYAPEMKARILSDAAELARLRAESAEKDERIAGLVAALLPFAEWADRYDDGRLPGDRVIADYSAGSLRRALAALSAAPAPRTLPEEGTPEWEAMVQRMSAAICRASPNHVIYHYPCDAPRPWKSPGGAIYETHELPARDAAIVEKMAIAALRAALTQETDHG